MDEILTTWYPDLERPNKHGLPDAAHADFVFPEVVTVLAPGRKGRFFWRYVEGVVIAVNAAVRIPVNADFWITADRNAAKCACPWFVWGMENYHGLRIFAEDINDQVEKHGDYTFYLKPDKDGDVLEFMLQPYRVDTEVFRATESTSGIAIDFAIRYGARHINLIGVDMEGGYFDDPPGMIDRDVVNGYVRLQLQKEIEYFQKRGITFRAVSPTRLEL